MRLACWNCSGFKSNFVYIRKLMGSVDILALSEHWLYTDELRLLKNLHQDFDFHVKVSDQNDINTRWKRGQGGVAINWRKHLKVQRLLVGDDRVAAIKIRTNNESFVFCSVYLPSTNSSLSEFMKSLKCLEDICVNLNYRQDKVVVAGDFNAHLFYTRSRQPETIEEKLFWICVRNLICSR